MKRLLKQETPMGPLYIAMDEDLFHIVWFGRRLGSSPTLKGAVELASGTLPAGGGSIEIPFNVVANPAKWILTKS
jgi:hypothetical protein